MATVSITVTSVNDAPVASDDAYFGNEDEALNVSAPGVLANDSDVDGDALTEILVSDVSHGTLTLNADGSFTYTPATDYNGTDSFTYKANDGELDSNVATVSIILDGVNDAPVADAGDDQVNVLTGRAVTLDGSGSSDVDGDLITYNWRFESVPPTSVLTDDDIPGWATPAPSFIPDVEGDFALSLVVNDYELSSFRITSLFRQRLQSPPNADAGGKQEVLLGKLRDP